MARKKRTTPGVNGSSSADIAFMLLIFFLVTTSMDTDAGLKRRLPPLAPREQKERPVEINERNIMRLLINRNDELVISKKGEVIPVTIETLKDKAVEFIMNPNDDPTLPMKEVREIHLLGNQKVVIAGYAISLKTEIETSYQMFVSVQDELLKAYDEVWDKYAKEKFGKPFDALNADQKKAVNDAYPMHISEMPLSNLAK